MAVFAVELYVHDVHETAKFFEQVLKLSRNVESPGYIQFRTGAVNIMICAIDRRPDHPAPFTAVLDGVKGLGVEVVMSVDDVDRMAEECSAFGLFTTPIVLTPWNRREFFVRLPEGYLLRLVESGKEQ